MTITVWADVQLNATSRLLMDILEFYPGKADIYITSSVRDEPGSYHSGNLTYGGSPAVAVDIGFGGTGFPAKGRDVAKWLIQYAPYIVELIHTTPFADDNGFYVKNQAVNNTIYDAATKAAHANHVHFATSVTLANQLLALLRGAVPPPVPVPVPTPVPVPVPVPTPVPAPVPATKLVGLDYAWSHPSPLSSLKGLGYSFVSRYLSWLPNGKVITASERDQLLALGINIALNWEYDSTDQTNGAAGGTKDATEAVKQAKALGYPAGSTIYYSADFDVQLSQWNGPIKAYQQAAKAVTNAGGYRFGVYGGLNVIRWGFDSGILQDGWQTYAWSGGSWDSRATLRQVQNGITVLGADCDRDETTGGPVYFWNHGAVTTPPPVTPPASDLPPEVPMDSNFEALCWREEALLRRFPLVRSGPTVGEPNKATGKGKKVIHRKGKTAYWLYDVELDEREWVQNMAALNAAEALYGPAVVVNDMLTLADFGKVKAGTNDPGDV